LPLERWDEFAGAGIYYAATELEARSCADGPVTVVGGGNGAGQAALYLASCGCDVTVVIRRPEIESGMSRYLVDRLLANPKITVRGGTEVTRLDGGNALESIALVGPDGELHEQACRGLFCFIGAEPATGWLTASPSTSAALSVPMSSSRATSLARPGQRSDAGRSLSRRACPASLPSATYATAR